MMVKNIKTRLFVLFVAVLLASTGCGEKENGGGGGGVKADLTSLSIGGMPVQLRPGVSGESWNAASFDIRAMDTAEVRVVNSRMDKPVITADISDGASVNFAHMSTEAKPEADSFGAGKEFTFSSADYLYIRVTNENVQNYYRVRVFSNSGDARLSSLRIAGTAVTLGVPGKTAGEALESALAIKGLYEDKIVYNPAIASVTASPSAGIVYSVGGEPGEFSPMPGDLADGDILWVKVTAQDGATVLFYKIKVSVEYAIVGYGTADPAWVADSYNADLRIFPNAPNPGILEYDYFNTNAPPSYWNGKSHNHKYPDLFHFANGNKVENIADWENRQKEIFNILQYYMHGKMPSIDPDVLEIRFSDAGDTCTIDLTHLESGRTAQFVVNHTPPAGAVINGKNNLLLFGVGQQPSASNHPGWGVATFQTVWGGAENTRAGTCATLYGLVPSAADTPSVNMEYAWAMSVILSVIEQGGLNGYYEPSKIGIYGFSRWGKAAMCIGAFAKSRNGAQIGFTFVGSAGCGGPAVERWLGQMGYLNHTADPLPVSGDLTGVNSYRDLKGIEWFTRKPIADDHNSAAASEVVRGWTADTPGIPAGAHIYNEYVNGQGSNFIRNPGPGYNNPTETNSWGRIQVWSQARSEMAGWFSQRFQLLQALHTSALLDKDSGGVVCTAPFDSHYLAALIAPRIIYYEDGYDTMRNNPEGQWANWLMNDEVYQMYAEELGDPSIIWRNVIKMYDIPHSHQAYQDQDEYDLVTAIYSGVQPNAKFRIPPFPADDPRYRWDFDRMDWGRPGHPTIAERVRLMRDNAVPVKAVDERGLLDTPEPM